MKLRFWIGAEGLTVGSGSGMGVDEIREGRRAEMVRMGLRSFMLKFLMSKKDGVDSEEQVLKVFREGRTALYMSKGPLKDSYKRCAR